MENITANRIDVERLTASLQNELVKQSHSSTSSRSINEKEAVDIARRVMSKIDINNPAFAHKGTS